MKKIKLYTDGACSQNPGPGGWAFVMILKDVQGEQSEQELLRGSGGEKLTTNNRMELLAVIPAHGLSVCAAGDFFVDKKVEAERLADSRQRTGKKSRSLAAA